MAKLSADKTYVTVELGDTLYDIAKTYGNGTTWQRLAQINEITVKGTIAYIYVGQKVKLSGAATTSKNNTSKAIIKHFGLQSKTDNGSNRTVFATWTWTKSNTENYQVKWEYDTGDGVWFVGTNSTVTEKQSIYDAPTHAKRIRFTVKPISKKRTVNGKESSYWTAGWSTAKQYSFSNNPPGVPPVPTVTVDGFKLKASLTNLNVNASIIQFELYRTDTTDNKWSKYSSGKASISAASAVYEFKIVAGYEYKVRCRSSRDGIYSNWTEEYSAPVGTIPATPSGFKKCVLQGDNHDQVHLEWDACKTATSYEIEYTQDPTLFDGSDGTTKVSGIETTQYTFTKLGNSSNENESKQYFFRLRAKNDKGESGWSEVSSTNLGKAPAAPTTWSSTNSVILGESVTLYWIHNSEDGTSQTSAQLKIITDGVQEIKIIPNTTDEDEKDKTSKYVLPTAKTVTCKVELVDDIYVATDEIVEYDNGNLVMDVQTDTGLDVYSTTDENGETIYYCVKTEFLYADGANIQWAVSTMGEKTDAGSYSEWSTMRSIDIYAPPSVNLAVTDSADNDLEILESFPFYLSAITEPKRQAPVGFYISIVANETYETVDLVGNAKIVLKGESIYTRYIDASGDNMTLNEIFSASDVDLENNKRYTIKVSAYMNSGLTAEATHEFEVLWLDTEDMYEPNAEIIIDEDSYAAYIRPHCEDSNGKLIEGVTLSVYRREFDGSFTEIATDLANEEHVFVTDPHPALDFARYRIVATTRTTGAVSYCDLPGVPVGCTAAIIQWDEDWTAFNTGGEDGVTSEQPWAGSLLRLPYNIDITHKTKPDVELVEYIGRKHPVGYYGTQVGETETWSTVIPKDDKETLYALRRLAAWMGNVYVREPSGTGFWAHVTVSIPLKHRDVTSTISIDVTRVEGGI